ncbi:MAG TPA: DUF2567 domain-containing protein, partial [Rugosimonospora sp.]|nr:DUF2567 domain-containing protein [Rugosimonospora sp.]
PAVQPGPDPAQPPGTPPDYPLPEWAKEALAEPERDRLFPRGELAAGAAVAAVIALLGLGLGGLWSAVAPWVPAMRTADGAILAQPEQEQMIAGEGWYLFLTVPAGIAVAVLAWVLLRRYRGVAVLIGIVLGSVASGIIAYKFGHDLGRAHARYLADNAPIGTTFSIPPNLRAQAVGVWHGWLPYAKGDVLSMAIAAAVVYLLLAGFSPYPSLRRPPPAPEQPTDQADQADQADQPAPPVSSGW